MLPVWINKGNADYRACMETPYFQGLQKFKRKGGGEKIMMEAAGSIPNPNPGLTVYANV